MASTKNKEAIIFAVLSSIFSSTAIVLASIGIHNGINPILFFSMSAVIGSIIMLLIIYTNKDGTTIKKIKQNLKDIIYVMLLRGLIGSSLLNIGLGLATGIEAIFFSKMEPYFVLLIDWITGKTRPSKYHLVLLCVHLAGVFLLATGGVLQFTKFQQGDAIIIMAVFLFALSYKYGTKINRNLGSKNSTLLTIGTGGLILLPIALLISSNTYQSISANYQYLLGQILFFYLLGITLWFASLKLEKSWVTSALRAVGPVFAAPLAFIFFGEVLNTVQILGGILILSTSFLIAREHI